MSLFKKKDTSVVRKVTITKKNIKGRWPFVVDEVAVYCMAGASVYCEIKGSNFALNGFSQDVLKLKHIFDTKLVKTEYINGEVCKYSIGKVIDLGLNLFTEKEVNKLRDLSAQIKHINKGKN